MIKVREQVIKSDSDGFVSEIGSSLKNTELNTSTISTVKSNSDDDFLTIDAIPDNYTSMLDKFVAEINNDINNIKVFFSELNKKYGINKTEHLNLNEIIVSLYTSNNCYIIRYKDNTQKVSLCNNETRKNYILYSVQNILIENDIFRDFNFRLKYYGVTLNNQFYIIKIVEVCSLFIKEEFRRKGIGTLLFNGLFKEILQVFGIVVRSPLLKAQLFYAKQGLVFLISGITPEIYDYIKDYLNFKLKDIKSVYPQLNIIEDVFGFKPVDRISDYLVLEPTKENIKGYVIDRYINNISVYVDCGVWFDTNKIKSLIDTSGKTQSSLLKLIPKVKQNYK